MKRNETLKRIISLINQTDLKDQQKYVVIRRLEGTTLASLGIEIHVGSERVRQIEVKALRILQHPSRFGKKTL